MCTFLLSLPDNAKLGLFFLLQFYLEYSRANDPIATGFESVANTANAPRAPVAGVPTSTASPAGPV